MDVVWLVVGLMVGSVAVSFALRRPATAGAPTRVVGDPGAVPANPVAVDAPAAVGSRPEHLRQALDAIDLGVVIADAAGHVVVRNRRASTGSTGSVHSDVLVEEAVSAMLERARRGEAGERALDLFGPPARVLVVRSSPLADGGAVATVEDVTERSRVDSVRTDFVANVSHELKTPVGAIAVLAEALVGVSDPEVIDRFAGKMVAEAHRMASTIDDLLELSRIELGGAMEMQVVDVPHVVAEAIMRVEAEAQARRITITSHCPSGVVVHGDARQLVSALGNLVENAVKYSDDGATVHVTAAVSESEVTIEVADCGVGIPARDLDRVFERFYRVDRGRSRATGGTGLGLSIVRHVATNHRGRVTVTSREGEGSTFSLVLPSAVATGDAA